MRHVMVLNAKGGSGKTTIATNLASYFASQGQQVLLADFDPQEASLSWLAERSAGKPPIQGASVRNGDLRPGRKIDWVIMDAPAAVHGRELKEMVKHAETLLVPVLPSPIDMRAAVRFIEELKASAPVARKRAKLALVANRVREYTNIWLELEEFLKQFRIPMLSHLRDSQNYIRSASQGLGIFDFAPAATDIDREQWAPIISWLESKRSRP